MKLYLAIKSSVTLVEGETENVLGVFDSEEKAWEYLRTTKDFEHSEGSKHDNSMVYYFNEDITDYWHVGQVELNKPIYEDI